MRLPSHRLLGLLALAAAPMLPALADAARQDIEGYATDANGRAILSSSGECWRNSAWTPGEASPAGCASGALRASSALPASTEGTAAGWQWPTLGSAGASSAQAVAGNGVPTGIPGYLTDSRGTVVRSGFGDCWRTGLWTPALATVVGCDGVLAKAVPVPAPAPSHAQPPAAAAEASPPAAPQAAARSAAPPVVAPTPSPEPAPRAAPDTAPAERSGAVPVPVTPSVPATPDTQLAPDQTGNQQALRSEKVTLDTDAYFDFDKSELKPDGRRKLDELANRLSGMQLEVVVATGHTDAIGTRKYNEGLSMRRAQAVRAFLAEKGLAVDKIFTSGKGEMQPVASNKTREGRAKNRRVEVEMVGIRQQP